MPRRVTRTAYRIATFYAVTFAVATILLGIAANYAAHRALKGQLDDRLRAEVAELRELYDRAGVHAVAEIVASREHLGGRSIGYMVLDSSGHRLSGELNTNVPPIGWSSLPFKDANAGDDEARVLAVRLPDGNELVVGEDAGPLEQIDETFIELFAAAFGLMLIVGITGSYFLGRATNRRLEEVNAVASAIIDGDLSRRMPITAKDDEFDRLSGTLNRMLERIQVLMTNLRQVTGDIAHDLRTPLTRTRQKIEAALVGRPSQKDREALEEAAENVDQVLSLFSAILRIAEVEAGALQRGFARVDLSDLARGIADSFATPADDSGKKLTSRIQSGIVVLGDRDLLAQALTNLLDNALVHTPAGTDVSVELIETRGVATLSVVDTGPGVPEAERERMFHRFTRLERSRSTPGHGLGLALVAAVGAAHGGDIRAQDAHPGLAVGLRLRTIRKRT
jgi:signal transduction histidine kinase